MRAIRTAGRLLLLGAWLPAALIALWWWRGDQARSAFFPPASDVLRRFGQVWLGAALRDELLPSVRNLAEGVGVALLVGVSVGVLIGLLPVLGLLVEPFLQFLRAMPGIALLPALLLLVGVGDTSKVTLIAFGSLWPILLNTVDGVRSIAAGVRQTARSYRITPANVLVRVVLPGAFPQISIGIRLSLSIALVLMVGSEYYGATHGVGYYILQSQQQFQTVDMWTGVVLLGILGYLISVGYGLLADRLLRWR